MNVLRHIKPGAKASNYVLSGNLCKSLKEHWFPQSKRHYIGETYEGTGKTTGHILNKLGVSSLCIDGITEKGFTLTNSWRIMGPTIFFPQTMISWKIKDLNCINKESLTMFTVLQPKVDLLLIGYGRKEDMTYLRMKELFVLLNGLDVNFEIMSTEDAAATFNFCSLDKRFVAAALIPPSKVSFHHELDLTQALAENEMMKI